MTSNRDKRDPTGPESSYADLWSRPGYLVRRLHQIHAGLFSDELAPSDITPVQFGLLTVLRDGQAMDQITLATEVGIDRTSGADVIRRLERRGLVERIQNPADRRAKIVRITAAGSRLVAELQPAMERAQARLLGPLSEGRRREFIALMQELIRANNAASRAPLRADRLRGADTDPPDTDDRSPSDTRPASVETD